MVRCWRTLLTIACESDFLTTRLVGHHASPPDGAIRPWGSQEPSNSRGLPPATRSVVPASRPPRIGEYRKARYSLGCLEVLPFEMAFLEGTGTEFRSSFGTGWSVRKAMVMSTTTDPPSDERRSAEFWRWARCLGRKLVNRRMLMAAFQVVYWTTRIVKALKQLYGDF